MSRVLGRGSGLRKLLRITHDKCEPFSAISVSNMAYQGWIYRRSMGRNLSLVTKRSVLPHADLSEKGKSTDYPTSGRESWHSEYLERPRATISRYRWLLLAICALKCDNWPKNYASPQIPIICSKYRNWHSAPRIHWHTILCYNVLSFI